MPQLDAKTLPAINNRKPLAVRLKKYVFVYILLAPALIATFVFNYLPLPGILIAFKDYDIFEGILKSPWASDFGLKYIKDIFQVPMIYQSIFNTLYISVLLLIIGFPAPILLALLLNEVRNSGFRRVIQTLSFLPHFLSWISVIAIVYSFYAISGPLNDFLAIFFGEGARQMFMAKQSLFVPNVIIINLWKELGWSCVIYLAAIAALDVQQYEAACIDGATRFQQIRYITIPGIIPTAMILLILRLGGLFASNFELIYGLQNPFINFEVISTVVFKSGIQQANYSMATAVGFMNGVVAFVLTFASNKISNKVSGISVW